MSSTSTNEYEDLEQARIQIATLKTQVDSQADTINRLDKEVAALKDSNADMNRIKENMLASFQELYTNHKNLEEQVLNTITATSITNGKLTEALVKYKFIIPEANQQQ